MINSTKKGSFLVVDGPSVSGKNSLIKVLALELKSRGVPVFLFNEDDIDPRRGEILRARERGKELGGSGDKEMAQVLTEHRAELCKSVVAPRLKMGEFVIANRGEPATLAYQTARGELTMDVVWKMHREKGILIPNFVILTTLNPVTAMAREAQDKQTSVMRRERESGSSLSGKVAYDGAVTESERLKKRELIHIQYDLVGKFLEGKGIPVLTLDTENKTVQEEVGEVLTFLQGS